MAKLGDVFSLQITGEWGSECDTNQACTKILRTTNFTSNGTIDYSNIAVRKIAESKIEKKRLKKGDIILEKSGGTEKTPVGRVVFCDKAIENDIYLCNNFTQAMRVNPAVAYPRYVFYFMWYLHYSGKTDLLQNKTTGIRNLRVKSYLDEKILLPSLDEQRRIAVVLDKISDLIALRRAQLDKLDLLVKSRFVEMFGDPVDNSCDWDTIKLKDVGTCKNGMNFHTDDFGVKIHCLGVADFKDYSFMEGTSQLSVISLNEMPKEEYLLKNNDIVFVRSNGNKSLVGRSLLVYPGTTPTTFSGFCIRFRLQSESIRPIYLLRVSKTDSVRKKLAGRGANIQNLNQKLLLELAIPVPPLELQDSFENFERSIIQLHSPVNQSLNRLEMLKESLMQQYFE